MTYEGNEKELETAWQQARSASEDRPCGQYIGAIRTEAGRVMKFYRSQNEGGYVYETYNMTEHGLITEEEYIFRRKLARARKQHMR